MSAEPHDGPASPGGIKGAARDLFTSLIKLALTDAVNESAAWRAAALQAQRQLAAGASEADALHADVLWNTAVKAAESDPVVQCRETANPVLPTMSPLSLAELATDRFDLDAAVQAIRDVSSFG